MATAILPTVLCQYQADYKGIIDANEWTRPSVGAFDLMNLDGNRSGGIISPGFKAALKKAFQTTPQIPVMKQHNFTLSAGRAVTISEDNGLESAWYTVTPISLVGEFSMIPVQFLENAIDRQTYFNKEMQSMTTAMLKSLDSSCATTITAYKNQVWPATGIANSKYTITANVVNATDAQKDQIMGDAKLMMEENDLFGENYLLTNYTGLSVRNQVDKYGTYNQLNNAGEFGQLDAFVSKNIANEVDKQATYILAQKNNFAILTRPEVQTTIPTTNPTHKWGRMTLPGTGLEFGVYTYQTIDDFSAVVPAAERAECLKYSFASDIYLVTSYNSDLTTIPSPVIKVDVATT